MYCTALLRRRRRRRRYMALPEVTRRRHCRPTYRPIRYALNRSVAAIAALACWPADTADAGTCSQALSSVRSIHDYFIIQTMCGPIERQPPYPN